MKRTNKLKGMYALLVAVAACIGITIYASCSADEDYDGYASKDELFTLADGEMGRGENPPVETTLQTDLRTDTIILQIDDSTLNANIENKSCVFRGRYFVCIKQNGQKTGRVEDVSIHDNYHFTSPQITIERVTHNNKNNTYCLKTRFSAMLIGYDNDVMGRQVQYIVIPDSLFH